MGILNITPDSFSDGGEFLNTEKAVQQAKVMIQDGADIIDIGAESSGPGSKDVPETEEWKRLEPVLTFLTEKNIPLSVDTWKSSIAKKALDLGVQMINDVTAFRGDPKILDVLKESDCEIVIMYSKDPNARTTVREKTYKDPIQQIGDFLEERMGEAEKYGVDPKRIILDPGMGAFLSSDPEVSFTVIRELKRLKRRFPNNRILIGTSRKSFLGGVSDPKDPKKRLIASVTSALLAAQNGADILRVHDVKETQEAVNTAEAIQKF
jgi:dihydropteroate synthase